MGSEICQWFPGLKIAESLKERINMMDSKNGDSWLFPYKTVPSDSCRGADWNCEVNENWCSLETVDNPKYLVRMGLNAESSKSYVSSMKFMVAWNRFGSSEYWRDT